MYNYTIVCYTFIFNDHITLKLMIRNTYEIRLGSFEIQKLLLSHEYMILLSSKKNLKNLKKNSLLSIYILKMQCT